NLVVREVSRSLFRRRLRGHKRARPVEHGRLDRCHRRIHPRGQGRRRQPEAPERVLREKPPSPRHPAVIRAAWPHLQPGDFAFFEGFDLPELLRATAWRTSVLNADSSTSSPSWMSIARRTFPSRLELKRRAGSFKDAPLAKVSFTTFLYDSPVQMMPSCDQIGVPIHFHSSTTSGSASLMSLRILLRVSPRQSPSSAILFEMSSDAGWPWLAPDFFMFSSWKFQICFHLQDSGG